LIWSCSYLKSNLTTFPSGFLLQFVTILNVSTLFIENYTIILLWLLSASNSIGRSHKTWDFQCKENYEKELINSYANPKLFPYIRTISKWGSLPLVLVKDSVRAVSDEEKPQSFNKYFYSVFTDSTMLLPDLEEVSVSSTISSVLKIYLSWDLFTPPKLLALTTLDQKNPK